MPSYRTIKALQVSLSPNVREIGPARDRFLSFLQDLALDGTEIEGWKLVFSEMLANAIQHGAGGDGKQIVRVAWWTEDSTLFVEVRDPGDGPGDGVLENPSLPEDPLHEGGRGLFIIRSFIDSWQYSRGSEGFCLRVLKRYPDMADISPEDPSMELVLDELAEAYENLTLYDRLGQAVAFGSSFAEFYRSTLSVFTDAGTPDRFHIEVAPGVDLPEFLNLADEPSHMRFGKARDRIWRELEGGSYVIWPGAQAPPPFTNGKEPVPPKGFAVPIQHDKKTVAMLAFGRDSPRVSMDSRELRQVQALGNIIGMALSRSIMERERIERDRIRHEFGIAMRLQQHLLPLDADPPQINGWKFFVHCEPAQEVAGDFAEIRPSCDGTLVGCVIDVMGKGVTAANLAGIFRSHFIAFSRSRMSPAEFVGRVNDVLEALLSKHTMFITAVVFRLGPLTGALEMVLAGHPPVVLLRHDGACRELPAANPPIGLFAGECFQSTRLTLRRGERCFVVTDGFFEWRRADGEIFGWEALVQWLGEQAGRPFDDIISSFHDLSRGGPGAEDSALSRDDETLLILSRLSES